MTTSRQRLERVRSAYTAGHTKHQRCKNRSPVAASSPMSFSNTFLYWVAVCERINYSAILSASDVTGRGTDSFLHIDYIHVYIYIYIYIYYTSVHVLSCIKQKRNTFWFNVLEKRRTYSEINSVKFCYTHRNTTYCSSDLPYQVQAP